MQPTEVALQVMAEFKDSVQSLAKGPSLLRLLRCVQRSALLQSLVFENPFFAQGESQHTPAFPFWDHRYSAPSFLYFHKASI